MQPMPPKENELKETIVSLKDSSLEFLKTKAELAAIESKEAAEYAKKKISTAVIVAFLAFFSYAIFLLLAHSLVLKFGASFLTSIQKYIPLTGGQIVLLAMLIFHLFFLVIYLVKLGKKSQEEFFALTKSEFKKDQQWLNEMNKNVN